MDRHARVQTDGLAEFLERTVLDLEFRELALTDPEKAMAGYQISDDAQKIVARRDKELLVLLSTAFQESWTTETPPEPPTEPAPNEIGPIADAETPQVATRTLQEVQLRLSLVPHALKTDAGDIYFNYEATLHPWPVFGETDETVSADRAVDGRVDLIVRIVPTIIGPAEGAARVVYAATIEPPTERATPGQANDPKLPSSSQDPASSAPDVATAAATRSLVSQVRQASPGDRYQKIVRLIRLLQEEDGDGGKR